MSWMKYKVGTVVTCGYCAIEHMIDRVQVYDAGIGFDLACGHRNGYCSNCDIPIKDMSNHPIILIPECASCDLPTIY